MGFRIPSVTTPGFQTIEVKPAEAMVKVEQPLVTILFDGKMTRLIKALHAEHPSKEWMMFNHLTKTSNGVFIADDAFFMPQQTSGANVTAEDDRRNAFVKYAIEHDIDDIQNWRLVTHSHHSMGAFFSGRDNEQKLDYMDQEGITHMFSAVTAYKNMHNPKGGYPSMDLGFQASLNIYLPLIELAVDIKTCDIEYNDPTYNSIVADREKRKYKWEEIENKEYFKARKELDAELQIIYNRYHIEKTVPKYVNELVNDMGLLDRYLKESYEKAKSFYEKEQQKEISKREKKCAKIARERADEQVPELEQCEELLDECITKLNKPVDDWIAMKIKELADAIVVPSFGYGYGGFKSFGKSSTRQDYDYRDYYNYDSTNPKFYSQNPVEPKTARQPEILSLAGDILASKDDASDFTKTLTKSEFIACLPPALQKNAMVRRYMEEWQVRDKDAETWVNLDTAWDWIESI